MSCTGLENWYYHPLEAPVVAWLDPPKNLELLCDLPQSPILSVKDSVYNGSDLHPCSRLVCPMLHEGK